MEQDENGITMKDMLEDEEMDEHPWRFGYDDSQMLTPEDICFNNQLTNSNVTQIQNFLEQCAFTVDRLSHKLNKSSKKLSAMTELCQRLSVQVQQLENDKAHLTKQLSATRHHYSYLQN